jgi:signal transduction histidine kinase
MDTAMAAVLYAATLLTTALGKGNQSLLASAVAGVAFGALGLRHRWPFPVLLVSTAAAEAYMLLITSGDMLIVAAPLIALYTVADTTNGSRRVLAAAGLAILVLAGFHALLEPRLLGPENVALAALGGLAIAAGDASRSRRAHAAEVEERALRAEREREQEAGRRVVQERLRIARDLHDMVGHHLALINVQAGVAAHVLEAAPDQALSALAHVRQSSRAALNDLRETIGLLRQPDDPPAPVEPATGLDRLDDLVAGFRRSGLRIDQNINGEPRPLPPAADLTAYRVIQESLTNVSKHARGAAVRLCLTYSPTALHVQVDDDGNSWPRTRVRHAPEQAAARGEGHGIIGMRERVAVVGGKLETGQRPDGGFRVRAVLPLHAGGPS